MILKLKSNAVQKSKVDNDLTKDINEEINKVKEEIEEQLIRRKL